jgi:hypothetical protein
LKGLKGIKEAEICEGQAVWKGAGWWEKGRYITWVGADGRWLREEREER